MKKQSMFIYALVLSIFIISPSVEAKAPDYNGGILNEYTYEEVFFLTGTPIRFSGKATVSEKESKGKATNTYKFALTSPEGYKLARSVVYEGLIDNHLDKGQTTSQTSIKSFSEKITIEKETYTLDDYQFSQGAVEDHRPASDYYSGNIIARKIYKFKKLDKTEELITVHVNGRNMGYENFWGATETQLIDYEITSSTGKAFVTSKVSDSKSRVLQYEPHDPSLSSFTGGHAVVSKSNMIGEYTYDIPKDYRYDAIPNAFGKGTIPLSSKMVSKIDRLIVPKFRDLSGSWAKEHIEKLYSLGVFDESTQFFSPNTPMNRYQYIVGVLKAVDVRVLEEPKSKKKAPKKAIFKDLDPKDQDYLYIESAVEKGITTGVTPDLFKPDRPITRAQAVTILVRSLGMEGRAPSPGYQTNYIDNNKIPAYAKDSVYVATELGLVIGNQQNQFRPNDPLTRAQSSVMLVRFLDFLEHDLKENYRDDILFFE